MRSESANPKRYDSVTDLLLDTIRDSDNQNEALRSLLAEGKSLLSHVCNSTGEGSGEWFDSYSLWLKTTDVGVKKIEKPVMSECCSVEGWCNQNENCILADSDEFSCDDPAGECAPLTRLDELEFEVEFLEKEIDAKKVELDEAKQLLKNWLVGEYRSIHSVRQLTADFLVPVK